MEDVMLVTTMGKPEFDYLLHVFETYVRSGMPSEELGIAAALQSRLKAVQVVPINLGKAKVQPTPEGMALELDDHE